METPIPDSGKRPGVKRGPIIAVVVAIIVVASASMLYFNYFSNNVSPSISGTITATTGQPYYTNISTKPFTSLTVYFGDGSSYTTHQSSTRVELNHTYSMPGTAFIYYNETLKGGGSYTSSAELLPVIVNAATDYINSTESLGSLPYNISASSTPLQPNEPVFSPGSHVTLAPSFNNEPVNGSWAVVDQKITEYRNATKVSTTNVPYSWDSGNQTFVTSFKDKMSLSNSGLYSFIIQTSTSTFNNITGKYGNVENSFAFKDVAVFNGGNITQTGLQEAKSVFTIAENELGGFSGLDGAVYADSISEEVMMNVYQHLVVYNGSNVQFDPQLATQVPTIANGGINDNYANYTQSYVNQTGKKITYEMHIQPYENYTFTIRANETFQNGDSVTAWDVMYSLARDMLFAADPPSTPGYIFAQNFLPGDFSHSNTFYNITHNITVNNQTQSITLHFGHPISPNLVFEIISAGGTYVMDAKWIAANGGGITWTPAGFLKYRAEGAPSGYVPYVEQHAMANGPYVISYVEPGQEVVLTKNPDYVSPGAWAPSASIQTIRILYIGEGSSRYLLIKSGEAQSAGIASSNFNEVQQLTAAGKASTYFFPTITVTWYNLNANINLADKSSLDPNMNLPSHFFASQNVRKAFAYAYDYPLYFSQQVGNAIYNKTFGAPYAGMLPVGMPGAQTISDLNNTTNGVPYFNMAIAKKFWSYVDYSKLGLTNNSGTWEFNGQPLEIPIIIFTGDPADQAGAYTWGKNLQKILPGATFPILALPFPEVLGYSTPGGNPMPIYFMGWEPDYPYPTDYVGPMEYPSNASMLVGGNGMVPYVMQQYGNTSEVNALNGMIHDYQVATTSLSSTQQIAYFQKVNEQAVNMTFYVALQQQYQYWVVSPTIKPSSITNYEENIMFGGGTIMLFNYLQYT